MNIEEAKAKINASLSPILERALAEGLCAKLEITTVGKDLFKEELDFARVKFISAAVRIFEKEGDLLDISFGVAVECHRGVLSEEQIDEDLAFANDRAEEFFSELSEAEDKAEFLKEKIAEQKALAEEAAENIRKTVKTSFIGGVVALCVGVGILLAAAAVMIFVL